MRTRRVMRWVLFSTLFLSPAIVNADSISIVSISRTVSGSLTNSQGVITYQTRSDADVLTLTMDQPFPGGSGFTTVAMASQIADPHHLWKHHIAIECDA